MRRHVLGKTGIEVSTLGFGCVRLTAHPQESEAIAVLEEAAEQGITHFDVARLYGLGRAETILGRFLKGRRDRVTVATKFGLQPPTGLAGSRWVINAAKRLLRPFPGLLGRVKKRAGQMVQSDAFTPSAALLSLETSLRELQTDYVDLLLLHECSVEQAINPELCAMLEKQVASGKVRCLGIASEFSKYPSDTAKFPELYQVMQFNHNAVTRNLPTLLNAQQRAIITHGVFGPARRLNEAIRTHPSARLWSQRMNVDLFDVNNVNSLLLHYNIQSNVGGATLFSSMDPVHIRANALDADSKKFDERQISLFAQCVDELLNSPADRPPAAK